MSVRFDPNQDLVYVSAEAYGASGQVVLRMALDTGATQTLVRRDPLLTIGYDLDNASEVAATTGSGEEQMLEIVLLKLTALGQDRSDLPVLCYDLPTSLDVDGLVGLDFIRGHVLTIDFRNGELTLS